MDDSIAPVPYTTDTVTSRDGTIIGYRQLGSGPGLILLHGSMQAAQNFMSLGASLADTFTVYIPDRRGRGLSGAPGDAYGIAKECEDVDALLNKTGARYVFGLSSGGLIALQAALTLPAIHKVAVYEPALSVNHSVPRDWIPQYEREIAEGQIAAALITVVTGLDIDPAFSTLPRERLIPVIEEEFQRTRTAKGPHDVAMEHLIPTQILDIHLVSEMESTLESFKEMHAHVLLMEGGKSPAFLGHALNALNAVLPHVERVGFPDLDHLGPSEGAPECVANELKHFLCSSHK